MLIRDLVIHTLLFLSGDTGKLSVIAEKRTFKKDLTVLNSENIDWEDLASDSEGHIYIGDFGNNSKKKKSSRSITFRILKTLQVK